MTVSEFFEYFRIWGPLGLIAALSLWGNVHQYRNGRSDSAAATAAVKVDAAERVAASLAQALSHHAQMTEATNRFVEMHEAAATENRELTGQVRSLIEVVSRKQRGR